MNLWQPRVPSRTHLRTAAVVAVAVLAVLVAFASTTVPAWGDPSGSTVSGSWQMNEPRGATRLVDSSGKGRNGTIGSEVVTGYSSGGAVGHDFPTHFPKDASFPGHVTTVGEHSSLDPQGQRFAVTIRYKTVNSFGNIVQKGQNGAAGGYWKLEAPEGQPRCVFSGGNGVSQTPKSPVAIDDGRWHTVTCYRTLSGAELWVDGVRRASTTKDAGAIDNAAPLAIGGKSKCGGSITCDYFFGEVDYLRITKG